MEKMKNEVEEYPEGFDGTFYFTNPYDEDFVTLWNNKEYTYPAETTVPMIIANESMENIQQIRKYFAKRLAEREFFKSKDFGNQKNGLKSKNGERIVVPSMYNEAVLQPFVDACLKPLQKGKATVRRLPDLNAPTGGSKSFSTGNPEALYPSVDLNAEFVDKNKELLSK